MTHVAEIRADLKAVEVPEDLEAAYDAEEKAEEKLETERARYHLRRA